MRRIILGILLVCVGGAAPQAAEFLERSFSLQETILPSGILPADFVPQDGFEAADAKAVFGPGDLGMFRSLKPEARLKISSLKTKRTPLNRYALLRTIRLPLLNTGDLPVVFSISCNFAGEETIAITRNQCRAYPGRPRQVVFHGPFTEYPAWFTITVHGPAGSQIIWGSPRADLVIYDMEELRRTVEIHTDDWKELLSKAPRDKAEHGMAMLAMVNTPLAASLLAEQLPSKRNGLRIFKHLSNMSPALRLHITQKIAALPHPGTRALCTALLQGCDEWEAVKLFQKLGGQSLPGRDLHAMGMSNLRAYSAVETYIAMLKNEGSLGALAAAHCLQSLHPLDAVPGFVSLLENPDLSRAAVHGLGAIKNPVCLAPLFQAAARPELTFAAGTYLLEYALDEHIPHINNLALSEHPAVRATAARLFSRTIKDHPDPTIGALRLLIKDPFPTVRSNAADSLAYAGTPEYLVYLHEALQDASDRVVLAAVRAVGRAGNYKSMAPLKRLYKKNVGALQYAVSEEIATMQGTAPDPISRPAPDFRLERTGPPPAPQGLDFFRPSLFVGKSGPSADRGITNERLEAFVLPGYTEPVVVGVASRNPINELRIDLSDLTSKSGKKLKRSDMHVFIETEYEGRAVLEKRSFLIRVPAGASRNIWIMTDTPADLAPGTYEGQLSLGTTVLKLTFQVLPWKLRNIRRLVFPLAPGLDPRGYQQTYIKRNFHYQYLEYPLPYRENIKGIPEITAVLDRLPDNGFPAILNLGPAIVSQPAGRRGAWSGQVPPLHERRLMNLILNLQQACRANKRPAPIYMVSSNARRPDTEEARLANRLCRMGRMITGASTLAIVSSPDRSPADFLALTGGDMPLGDREKLRAQQRDMFRMVASDIAPARMRLNCGLFLWHSDGGGQMFRTRSIPGKPERLPLSLVAAAEGLKDLEYLNLLELLVIRVKRSVTEAHLIRRILDVEEKLTSLKTGLSPDPAHEVWADLNAEQLRDFLVRSCLSLELGVDF